jgi:acyl carrier protein
MGMEVVDLVLRVEKAFSIQIDNHDANAIRTVGDLYQLILSKVPTRGPLHDQVTWEKLRLIVATQLGLLEYEVLATSRFAEDLNAD